MFLHWVVSHLLHIIPTITLAGAMIGLPDLGGGTSEAIISTGGEGESGGGDQSTGTESEGTEGTETTGGESGQEPGKPQGTKEATPDWKTVPAQVKAHITELQKTDPKTANMLQNAVYTSQTMLKEFPGGLKEVKALKASLDEVGGLEEIKNISSTHKVMVDEQETLDSQAREGNPAVLDNFIQIAGPEGFSKLMTHALDKWMNTDRDTYSHIMSKILVNSLTSGGVVAELNLAFKMLGMKTPEATTVAMESLQKVAAWANNVDTMSKTPPKRAEIDPKIAEAQAGIENGKAQLFNSQFSDSFGKWRDSEISRSVKEVAGTRVLNDYQMSTLGQKIVSEIQNILTTDTEYMKNLNKIYNTRNMAELQKFTRNRTSKLLDEATKKAYKSLFSDPVKKVTKQADKVDANGKPIVQQQQQAVKGWQKVDPTKAPTPAQIDSKATSFEMKFAKQAILKDGTKVYWGTKVPA